MKCKVNIKSEYFCQCCWSAVDWNTSYNRANRKKCTSVFSTCVFVCVCHCFDMWFSEGHLHVLCMLCNGRWITSRLLFKGSVMVVCWGQITYYISVRHKFCSTAWSPDVLVKAEHCFGSRPIIILVSLVQLCLHWSCGMFFSEQGQVQLPPLEPISTEVRGHGYNSSAKGRISYSETAATSIWSILHRSIFERLLKT